MGSLISLVQEVFSIIKILIEVFFYSRTKFIQRFDCPKDAVICEVGVWKGDFSEKLLKDFKPRKLHLIDPWKFEPKFDKAWYGGKLVKDGKTDGQGEMNSIYNFVSERFSKEIKEEQVMLHRGASAAVASAFPDAYFDLVYIDGDHSYEGVKQDLEKYIPKVKSNGLIVMDDYFDGWLARRKKFVWWGDAIPRSVRDAEATGAVKMVGRCGSQAILRRF